MAHDSEPHPDTDVHGETIEFAAIEQEQPERVCLEISSGLAVRFEYRPHEPVEVRLGQTTETSPFFLHEGSEYPDLCKAKGIKPAFAHVLVQPDVMAKSPELGWLVIDGWQGVGREETPQFRFGCDISRRSHITLGPVRGEHFFEIVGVSANPTKVILSRQSYKFAGYNVEQSVTALEIVGVSPCFIASPLREPLYRQRRPPRPAARSPASRRADWDPDRRRCPSALFRRLQRSVYRDTWCRRIPIQRGSGPRSPRPASLRRRPSAT